MPVYSIGVVVRVDGRNARASSGETDVAQVEEIYRRYGPAVHRRALGLLGDPQEALDVTQETFLAFLRMKPQLRGEAAPFTVLYQIATYQAVDKLRKRARWSGALGPLTVDDNEQPETELDRLGGHEGGLKRVEAAQDLALLTKGEDAEVLTAAFLYFVEGYTTDEIGQVLDLSRKTVGKHLSRFAERARKRYARFTPKGGS